MDFEDFCLLKPPIKSSALDLPDECLSLLFSSLSQSDRNTCSLVCHSWYSADAQSRQRLALYAASALEALLPTLLTRFDSVTELALKTDPLTDSITDHSLSFISTKLPRLTHLKLRSCNQITDQGISTLATNFRWLRKISCSSCSFGPSAMATLLTSCPLLEDLSLKRLREFLNTKGNGAETFTGSDSLKSVCLKDSFDAQWSVQYLSRCKNLRTIKILRCSGPWDGSLDEICSRIWGITEVHLEKLQVSDRGLYYLSKCSDLEILHIDKMPECTDAGIAEIASKCHMLRRFRIDGWCTNCIGDLGLIAISKGCPRLQELVLIGVNLTLRSLLPIGYNCCQLERLVLCGCETVGDLQILWLADHWKLKEICIVGCPVSELGLAMFVQYWRRFTKVNLKRHGAASAEWVRSLRREGLAPLALDTLELQQEQDMDCVVAGCHIVEMIDRFAAVELSSGSRMVHGAAAETLPDSEFDVYSRFEVNHHRNDMLVAKMNNMTGLQQWSSRAPSEALPDSEFDVYSCFEVHHHSNDMLVANMNNMHKSM